MLPSPFNGLSTSPPLQQRHIGTDVHLNITRTRTHTIPRTYASSTFTGKKKNYSEYIIDTLTDSLMYLCEFLGLAIELLINVDSSRLLRIRSLEEIGNEATAVSDVVSAFRYGLLVDDLGFGDVIVVDDLQIVITWQQGINNTIDVILRVVQPTLAIKEFDGKDFREINSRARSI